MLKWSYLVVGSIIGGLARYVFAGAIYERFGTDFPYGTLIVNLSGCLLIGIFNSLATEKFVLGVNERVLWMTGFCGAYTTFSTWILETSNLLKNGEILRASFNVLLSSVGGFAIFRFGELLGRLV